MTLASLMTESVQILRRTVFGEDSSGNEEATFPVIATVDAFVGRAGVTSGSLSTTETVAGRDQVVAEWGFMFPAGTDVRPYDRLVHAGRTFEVVGLPALAMKPGAGEQFRTAKALWVEG